MLGSYSILAKLGEHKFLLRPSWATINMCWVMLVPFLFSNVVSSICFWSCFSHCGSTSCSFCSKVVSISMKTTFQQVFQQSNIHPSIAHPAIIPSTHHHPSIHHNPATHWATTARPASITITDPMGGRLVRVSAGRSLSGVVFVVVCFCFSLLHLSSDCNAMAIRGKFRRGQGWYI